MAGADELLGQRLLGIERCFLRAASLRAQAFMMSFLSRLFCQGSASAGIAPTILRMSSAFYNFLNVSWELYSIGRVNAEHSDDVGKL
jgi:hypothetical protein